jgi:hypothetical protein
MYIVLEVEANMENWKFNSSSFEMGQQEKVALLTPIHVSFFYSLSHHAYLKC